MSHTPLSPGAPVRVLVLCIGAWCAAATVSAGEPQLRPSPVVISPGDVNVVQIPDPNPPGCTVIYDNRVNFSGSFYSSQDGAEAIDDLHGIEGGGLCSFWFGYNAPGSGPVQATVTFYSNPAGADNPPESIVAGPFVTTGLPSGANEIEVTVPGGTPVSQDLWMGVKLSTISAGLLIADPPVVGTSHDYFYEVPPGGYFFFGGAPRANFYLGVKVDLLVPVRPTGWGGLKSRYR